MLIKVKQTDYIDYLILQAAEENTKMQGKIAAMQEEMRKLRVQNSDVVCSIL